MKIIAALALLVLWLTLPPAAPALAADPSDTSPLGPAPTAGKIPVLLVKGEWSQHWNLNDALSTPAGMYGVTNSYVSQQYGYTFALKYFPDKKEDLMSKRVVVLGNVPTTALARQGSWADMRPVPGRSDQWLVDFVDQGGGLLVLGGSFSFDLQNKFKDSALAAILPVELGDKGMRFEDQNKPLELKPASQHPILDGLDFKDHPITLFYHPMKIRKDAIVVITAGDAPILVLGTHGKGRVAVFLATLHGDPAKDVTPYWQWKSWPVLVRNIVNWLAE
jgi:uncharacterized membrane protein